MQLFLENFWASALSILETEIIERQQLEEALQESQEEIQQKERQLEQAQQELKRAEAQVIQSEKLSSLRKQITSVVHQINNPVSFIHSNLEYARTYTQDLLHIMHLYAKHYPQPAAEIQLAIEEVDLDFLIEDLPKILSTMQMATERLREIIFSPQNVLGLNQLEMIVVDLHENIERTLMIFHQELTKHHRHYQLTGCSNALDIKIIKEYGELPLVECYGGFLALVFIYLLRFAIDAVKERVSSEMSQQTTNLSETATHYSPTITIRTGVSVDQTRALIQIADNGSGMTEERQRWLFDPSSMAKLGCIPDIRQSLYLSHQIVVEKHRGQLKCVSVPGKGTEFTIEIPIRQSHQ